MRMQKTKKERRKYLKNLLTKRKEKEKKKRKIKKQLIKRRK